MMHKNLVMALISIAFSASAYKAEVLVKYSGDKTGSPVSQISQSFSFESLPFENKIENEKGLLNIKLCQHQESIGCDLQLYKKTKNGIREEIAKPYLVAVSGIPASVHFGQTPGHDIYIEIMVSKD